MNEQVTRLPAVWPLSLRVIHWLSAALVFAMLALGFYMVQLVADPAERFDLTQTHKSIGVTMLVLIALRLLLRILTKAPAAEPAGIYVRLTATAVRVGLYALLMIMPLSGWLMVSTTPVRVPTTVFSLFDLPYPLSPDLGLYRLAHAIHLLAGGVLSAVVILHITGALAHAFWWRDGTLVRMWRMPKSGSADQVAAGPSFAQ